MYDLRQGMILVAALMMVPTASASDLGSAGSFRWIGGQSCLRDPTPCPLPAIDAARPVAEQSGIYVDRALQLIDALQLSEARQALDEAISRDPGNARAWTLRGRLALTNGDLPAAGRDIEQALRLKQQDPDILATRAYLRQSWHELAQSLEDINLSLKIRPDSPDALFIRAVIQMAFKQYELAFTDLSFALTLAPDDRRIRMMRADIQILLRQYQFAALDAAAVLKNNPSDAQALVVRATALEHSGDEEGAIRDLTTLLDTNGGAAALYNPRLRESALQRIRLLAKTGRSREAQDGMILILDHGGQQAILKLQLYLRANGYPNVEITGVRSAALDTALTACFTDRQCGPRLPPS